MHTTQAAAMSAAVTNLWGLANTWPLLVEERVPGTPRPWLQSRHGGRGQPRDVDDMSGLLIHGVTAPVRIDVLDQIVDTLRWLEVTSGRVARTLGTKPPGHVSLHDDPIGHFRFLRESWDALLDADIVLAGRVAVELAEHADRVSRLLGLTLDGRVLPFPCPYCLTLNALTIVRDDELGLVIVCTGAGCKPPADSSVHLWRHGRPVWRFAQWGNLAAAVSSG